MSDDAGKFRVKFKRTLEKFDGEKQPDSTPVEVIEDEWTETFPSMEAAQQFIDHLKGE